MKFYNSIRFKMTIIYMCLYFGALLFFSIVFSNSIESYFIKENVVNIKKYINFLSNNISVNGYLNNFTGISYKGLEDEIENISKMYDSRVLVLDKRGTVVNDSSGMKIGKIIATQDILGGLNGDNYTYIDKENKIADIVTPIENYNNGEIEGVIYISCSLERVYYTINEVEGIVLNLLIILGIVISCFILIFTRVFTKPLHQLLIGIKRIGNGHLNEKIMIGRNDEIEQISNEINRMTEKLVAIDNSRKEFVSNVSHELKTPLSSIKVLTESLLIQDGIPTETYKEFLKDINTEIDRQANIINDLLTLVKLDQKEKILNLENVNLNELTEQILKRLHPLANKNKIELILESFRTVNADVDEMKLTIALSNLIENGIKYNKENGRVTVTVDADHQNAYLTVADTGIGIEKDHFNKIFDRFYRVDKTRDRATGGTGLGLSIAYQSVLLHKGSINIESQVNVGTKFIVTVPLRQNKEK